MPAVRPQAADPLWLQAVIWAAMLSLLLWMPVTAALTLLSERIAVKVAGAALASLYLYLIVQRRKQEGSIPSIPLFSRAGYSGPPKSLLIYDILRRGPDGVVDYALEVAESFHFQTWSTSLPHLTLIAVHTPEHIQHIFEKRFENYVKGKYFHSVFEDALGDGIFNTDGAQWKAQRRVSSHLFTSWQLYDRMTSVFNNHAKQLLSVLSEAKGGVVDIQRLMYCYTFDCIYQIAFGKEVNALGGNPADLEFQLAFDEVQAITARRFLRGLWKVAKFLNIGAERRMAKSLAVIRGYVQRVLESYKQEDYKPGDGADLITLFMQQCEQEQRECTDKEIIDFITNFTIAGRDTTASVSTWCFYELHRHPDVLQKLEEEFDRVTDVQEMHYAQAVFQETVRMWPSVPLDFKFAVEEDVLPCGSVVRPGVGVMFNPYLFNRNPANFVNPNDFCPERWIEPDGTCRPYDPKGYAYPAFNAGPRTCLGRTMAAVEVKTILYTVLTNYKVRVVDGFEPQRTFTVVLMSKNGMQVTLTPRKGENNV